MVKLKLKAYQNTASSKSVNLINKIAPLCQNIPDASLSSSEGKDLFSIPFTVFSEISKTGISSSPRDFTLIINSGQ